MFGAGIIYCLICKCYCKQENQMHVEYLKKQQINNPEKYSLFSILIGRLNWSFRLSRFYHWSTSGLPHFKNQGGFHTLVNAIKFRFYP
jgi:hypothetical protein